MLRRVPTLALAAALVWPCAAVAQQDDAPPMLMISSWVCSFDNLGDIGQDWNARAMAAANAAVDAGEWSSAGIYFHDWADEWNVNYWAVGPDIPSLLKGQETSNEAYGEGGLNLWDVCSEHKDGFYWLGDSTTPMPEGPGPVMALSSWKCTDIGAVNDDWEDYALAKAQAVVDAGLWKEAGVFYHAWAGPWNANFYYMGDDIPAILKGWEMFTSSMGEDAPSLTDYCTVHKDGFYTFSQTANGTGG